MSLSPGPAPRLSDHERGGKYENDYDADLAALQARLERVQAAFIAHHRRAIVLLEGWDAAGKGGIVKRLTAKWDPRYFRVWPIAAPTPEELARHYLWRFWTRLPASREIAVFDRSWYGRVLVERVEGYATKAQWRAAYDEINAFEAEQIAHGTAIIKLFVHVTAAEQDRRLADRLDNPWKRWKTGPDDYRNRARRADYRAAIDDMLLRTHGPACPWRVIDGNNKKAARIAALTHIAERLEAATDMTPLPLDPAFEAMARAALASSAPPS